MIRGTAHCPETTERLQPENALEAQWESAGPLLLAAGDAVR